MFGCWLWRCAHARASSHTSHTPWPHQLFSFPFHYSPVPPRGAAAPPPAAEPACAPTIAQAVKSAQVPSTFWMKFWQVGWPAVQLDEGPLQRAPAAGGRRCRAAACRRAAQWGAVGHSTLSHGAPIIKLLLAHSLSWQAVGVADAANDTSTLAPANSCCCCSDPSTLQAAGAAEATTDGATEGTWFVPSDAAIKHRVAVGGSAGPAG